MEKQPDTPSPQSLEDEVYIEPEAEITPQSGHGKMPWFLFMIWTVNIIFYIYYFMRYGLPNLQQWLNH